MGAAIFFLLLSSVMRLAIPNFISRALAAAIARYSEEGESNEEHYASLFNQNVTMLVGCAIAYAVFTGFRIWCVHCLILIAIICAQLASPSYWIACTCSE
jgi:hypothetical protein